MGRVWSPLWSLQVENGLLTGEAEVRFLAQPSWPFEYTIAGVVEASDRPDDLSGYRDTPTPRVLLVEGRQACYADRRAFESVGSE